VNPMQSQVEYSVVIPVYNSTESLRVLLAQLTRVFTEEVHASYEIIMVDDASPNPDTWPTLRALAEQCDGLVIVQLTRNFGKTGAVLCGFAQARGAYVFTMDDDLQHQPSDVPRFIALKDHDVVVGLYARQHHSGLKRLTSHIKAWCDQLLLGKPRHVTLGPYRLHKASVVQQMLAIHTPYPFMPALLLYVTRDLVTVPIQQHARPHGHSDYTTRKRLRTFSHLLINNSSVLLRLTAALGVGIVLVSLLASLCGFIAHLRAGIPVPGWTSLLVVLLITNGLILFAIGVAGEYLFRITQGIEQRPPYLVRHVITNRRPADAGEQP
jgi:glycosyltransferase involved in cell wall biosynthesis